MIHCEEGLKQAQYWIAELERSLNRLRRRVLPINEQKFRIMAEGYIMEICRLREEIDEYLGIASFTGPAPRPSGPGTRVRRKVLYTQEPGT